MLKIYLQKYGSWNENDRLEAARLFVKLGYGVRVGKEKVQGKNTLAYFIEIEGDDMQK